MVNNPINKGANTQIYGTSLSLTRRFVKIPKANKPNNGPYVYPAILNIDETTESSLMTSNSKITNNITTKNLICTIFLCFTDLGSLGFSFLLNPKKSTQ